MKKLPFLCISVFAANFLLGQSHTLKSGTYLPLNNKAITILPSTPADQAVTTAANSSNKGVRLVGGSMNPLAEGENMILSNPNSLAYNGLQGPLSLTSEKTNPNSLLTKNSQNNFQSLTGYENNQTLPLTASNSSSFTNLNSNNNVIGLNSLTNSSNSIPTQKAPLEPLTYTPPRVNIQSSTVETLDPSRTYSNSFNNYSNDAANKTTTNIPLKILSPETLPPRNIVSGSSTSGLKMPELAPIEGLANNFNSNTTATPKVQVSSMPELAPIEGEAANTKTIQTGIPELAPIDGEAIQTQKQNQNQDFKPTNRVKGFLLPTGTLLQAKDNKSYIVKPIAPTKNIVPFKQDDSEYISGKPSAGGGIGFMADKEEINNNYIYEAATAEIPNQTQQQLQQAAKNHKHDPNNPCCRLQMSYATKKKVIRKKPVTYKKKATVKKPVVYAYKQDPVKTQNVERIVYVPVQETQQEVKQTTQVYKPQTTQQPQQSQQPKQSQEKVVYRDYTNTYTKGNPPSQSSDCNCPGTNQQSSTSKDDKKYYNPNNYANGLNSGPTSGDYPVSGNSSDVNMKYTFYVNPRGKYGVSIYNNSCSILLSQNGKVMEYKVFGDPKTQQPTLNYFGSPESISGIPIEYNYNRTVHKIGNITFDYDFEGFFKTVGNSLVFYNSRSSLSKVDNINVKYDSGGNVTSVDQNSGIIQYNP